MVTKKRDSKRPKFRGKNNIQKSDRLGYCPEGGFDYKAVGLLKKYISETGKIESAKRNGLSAKCQRSLTSAIKRARHMALLPFSSNHVYDTSLLSLGKDKINEESDQVNSSVEDAQANLDASDESEISTDEVIADYIFRAEEVDWPPYFTLAVEFAVASVFAISLARDAQLGTAMENRAERQFIKARRLDSQQQTTRKLNTSRFIAERRS